MTFGESISTCFSKYANFGGRATCSEFWWWFLFVVLIYIAAAMISEALSGLVALGTLLPSLAVATRRLHDTDRSGWWQLLGLIPLIGGIILLIWYVQEGKEPNRFNLAE